MKDWLKKGLGVFSSDSNVTEKHSAEYNKEKELSQSSDPKVRRKLAKKKTARPEILYYLADDKDESVRKEIARNTGTPMQASPILAEDTSEDVRLILAKKLTKLLPSLDEDRQSEIYAFATKALVTLARDEVLKVRLALSSSLKDKAYTPPPVAARLAKDAEKKVAEPMLRFCIALEDEDLLEIIKDYPKPWVLSAIAERETVSESVSDAIIEHEDVPSGQKLIGNAGARFFKKTLESIVEKAARIPEWQAPLVERKNLPANLAKNLANFVDKSLLGYLEKRSDYDKKTKKEILTTVRRRIDFENNVAGGNKAKIKKKVHALFKEGALKDELIQDALSWSHKDFVFEVIAVKAGITSKRVKEIMETAKPKPIVALCWKAELSMRLAVKIQTELARVPQKEILLAKGGLDYPLTEEEINWQLDFLGLKTAKNKLH